jgi:hypothetical protein
MTAANFRQLEQLEVGSAARRPQSSNFSVGDGQSRPFPQTLPDRHTPRSLAGASS